jgi:hypothetical protein
LRYAPHGDSVGRVRAGAPRSSDETFGDRNECRLVEQQGHCAGKRCVRKTLTHSKNGAPPVSIQGNAIVSCAKGGTGFAKTRCDNKKLEWQSDSVEALAALSSTQTHCRRRDPRQAQSLPSGIAQFAKPRQDLVKHTLQSNEHTLD